MSKQIQCVKVLLILCFFIFAYSQEQLQSNNQHFSHVSTGDMKRAAPQRLVDGQKIKEMDSIHQRAALLMQNKQYEQGATNLLRLYHQLTKIKGDEEQFMADILTQLASCYNQMNQIQKAQITLKRALILYKGITTKQPTKLCLALTLKGSINQRLQKYDETLQDYYQSLEQTKKINGNNSYQVSLVLQNIGTVMFAKKLYNKAQEILMEALHISLSTVGRFNESLLIVLYNLVQCHMKMRNYSLVIDEYYEIFYVTKQIYKWNQPSTLRLLQDFEKDVMTILEQITSDNIFSSIWNTISNFFFKTEKEEQKNIEILVHIQKIMDDLLKDTDSTQLSEIKKLVRQNLQSSET